MQITESKMMPHPGGFGWGLYSRVRTLAANETVPDGAVPINSNTPVPDSDWALADALAAHHPPPAAANPVAANEESKGTTK